MELVVIWVWFSGIIALIGMDRSIGVHEAFLFSLVFTPVIGFILTLSSGSKDKFDLESHKILTEIRKEPVGNRVMIDPMLSEKGLTPERELKLFKAKKISKSMENEGLFAIDKVFAMMEINNLSKRHKS